MIAFSFVFSGPKAEGERLLAPFSALKPVVATNETTPYPGVAHAAGTGVTDEVCQRGTSDYLVPIGLQSYNITTNRAVYNLYKKMVTEYPALAASIVQFEGYPQQAVQAVEPDSTAYAHRDDYVLVYVLPSLSTESPRTKSHSDALIHSSYTSTWAPNDTALAAVAYDYSHQARALLHAGDKPGRTLNAYVNYASTDETPEMLYGYEPWRLERLRGLKSKYDPRGRFNFYNPIG